MCFAVSPAVHAGKLPPKGRRRVPPPPSPQAAARWRSLARKGTTPSTKCCFCCTLGEAAGKGRAFRSPSWRRAAALARLSDTLRELTVRLPMPAGEGFIQPQRYGEARLLPRPITGGPVWGGGGGRGLAGLASPGMQRQNNRPNTNLAFY